MILIVTMYPLLWMLCGSINTIPQMGVMTVIPAGITFEKYQRLFENSPFLRYMTNTLIYATGVTLLSVLFNSMAAYALARLHFPGKNIIFLTILSTMMIPFSVTMIPLFIIVRSMKLVNSLGALIVPGMASGFGIFLLRQFYLGIPTDLEDAAKIDGMSYQGIFFFIIVPLSKPIILTAAVLSFLGAWNNYLWPLIINSKREVWVLTTGIANFVSEQRIIDWNMILTGSSVCVFPLAIMFAIFQRQLIEGVKLSGIK